MTTFSFASDGTDGGRDPTIEVPFLADGMDPTIEVPFSIFTFDISLFASEGTDGGMDPTIEVPF